MSTRTTENARVSRKTRRPGEDVPRVDVRSLAEGMEGATENRATVSPGPYCIVLACEYDDSRPSGRRS